MLYPVPLGRRGAGARVNHHELATYGLLGTEYSWVSEERAARERGWWEKLRARVHEWPGTAIVSAEALSVVRLDAARRTVEALGRPEATDVLITARGLGRLLPSCWQQWLRNGRGPRSTPSCGGSRASATWYGRCWSGSRARTSGGRSRSRGSPGAGRWWPEPNGRR